MQTLLYYEALVYTLFDLGRCQLALDASAAFHKARRRKSVKALSQQAQTGLLILTL